MIPATELNPKYDSPELTRQVKRGLRDVIIILLFMLAMVWLLVYVALHSEAVDAMAEFYQSQVCRFILYHQLAVSGICFLVGISGCVWLAKRN